MQYEPRRNNFYERLTQMFPPVTLNIAIINIIVWLAQMVSQNTSWDLTNILGLHYFKGADFGFWQPITYMFLHSTDGFAHLFFNMFALLMFGVTIERLWGSKRFLIYYLLCGLTAALSQEIVWHIQLRDIVNNFEMVNMGHAVIPMAKYLNLFITVGASGAVFGILLAFGMFFPNAPIYIFFIPIPVKAKYFVVFYGLLELFLGISSSSSNVAHFAHLGGMIGGLILILLWRKKGVVGGAEY